ncbi:MAG: tetratricopeptide repeat protein [Candidatus Thiodiazotropha lotti]|nr:tetratricopeptide repeat protein [Candidatus Thiodiazotropha lotti]
MVKIILIPSWILVAIFCSTLAHSYECKDIDLLLSPADSEFEEKVEIIENKYHKQLFSTKDNIVKAQVLYCMGMLYQQSGETKKSEEMFSKSIENNPNNVSAYFSRGLLYKDNSKLNNALEDFSLVIELDDNIPIVFFYRSEVNYFLHNYKDALQDLDAESMLLYGNVPLSRIVLRADIYATMGEYNTSKEYYLKALDVTNELVPWTKGQLPHNFPKEMEIYKKLLKLYCRKGNKKLAVELVNYSIERNISGGELLDSRCWQ